MKTMTATEASRHFSDLLDAVERGETITIVRGSHPVAEIGPGGLVFNDLNGIRLLRVRSKRARRPFYQTLDCDNREGRPTIGPDTTRRLFQSLRGN